MSNHNHPYRILTCPICTKRCAGELALLYHAWRHLLSERQYRELSESIGDDGGAVCVCGLSFTVFRPKNVYNTAMFNHWFAHGGFQEHLIGDVMLDSDGLDRAVNCLVKRSIPF